MQIVNETPFKPAFKVWQVRPPRPSLTVVVKATFALGANGASCRPAETQAEISGDVHVDDDETRALTYENDMAILKPQGECVLRGACHAPAGRTVATSAVAFQVGAVKKSLAVFGDRYWKKGLLASGATEPEPFARMDLTWERSFGGAGFEKNPLGRGAVDVTTSEGPRRPLPNIEDPRALVTQASSRPEPAGAFPLGATAASRLKLAGTYDERWRKTRWPFLPDDFDFHYFNVAPLDQRITGYFRGDEEIVLRNLVPGQVDVKTRLPGSRVRCFLATMRAGVRGFVEVPMNLDTIVLDTDAARVVCLFRGLAEIEAEDLSDVERLLVCEAPADDHRPVAFFQTRIAAADARAQAEEAAFAAEAVPSIGAGNPSVPSAPDAAGVLARIARREPMKGVDLTGANLAGVDLRAADLAGAVLANARLDGAQLDGAKLDGAVLAGASLVRASLVGASLKKADLTDANLEHALLTDAVLDGASFEGAKLAGATLRNASCAGTGFAGADLAGASLVGAKARRADFARAALAGADFTGAHLVEATLEGATATRAVFDECDATRLRAAGSTVLDEASFKNARLAGARFAGASLARANLSFADLAHADLENAALGQAQLNGCALRGTVLRGAKLGGASLVKSDAMGAVFEAADLSHADLRGANLFGANFFRARTDGARLELANTDRTSLPRPAR